MALRQYTWFRFGRKHPNEIDPDEILIDSENLPNFNIHQFEGRLEKPVSKRSIYSVIAFFVLVVLIFLTRIWSLQVANGSAYAHISENNRLKHILIFADRGIIEDRNGILLAWNDPIEGKDSPRRAYIQKDGFAHLLGYTTAPQKDTSGYYYEENFIPHEGVEEEFTSFLSGKNGLKIIETDALGKIVSESLLNPSKPGEELKLSIDADLQGALYQAIKNLAEKVDFQGGAGAIMDIHTGEILALTSYPEYSPQILSDGSNREAISAYMKSMRTPFLNRGVNAFIPGSVIKPYLALGALTEGIISPEKKILSTGSIAVPNPYFPGKESVFTDWKAHGEVDMRRAIAVSSNVYFYEIGGGYKDQKGLGITRIEKYMRLFGFGEKTGIDLGGEKEGVVPSPQWKRETFQGEEWRLGDTYNTAIGQYGVQVSPIQLLRATASIANNGILLTPTVKKLFEAPLIREKDRVPISPSYFQIIREGMREGVLDGTARALNTSLVKVGAKTGTAELGVTKQKVNSWVSGFFPYDNPRYAFVVLMEKGQRKNLFGSPLVMLEVFEYMAQQKPEMLE